jgi:CHAT domain-containing protein
MVRQVALHVSTGTTLRLLVFVLVSFVIPADSLFGQATPWWQADGFRSPNGNPEYSGPSTWSPPIPPVNGNLPGPNMGPTQQDTQRFIDSNPNLRALDPSLQQALIYNSSNPWPNSPILPNGTTNPFYQNGMVAPNWYLPSTWSSPQMNWQGVQANGFLTSPTATAYNPSSLTSAYNPMSVTSSYHWYQAPRPTPSQLSPQSGSRRPDESITAAVKVAPEDHSLGSRPSDVTKAIENGEHALALHETAGDKLGEVVDHADLARLFLQSGDPEQALKHIDVAEPMIKGDPKLLADLLRTKAAALVSSGRFKQSIDVNQQVMSILRSLNDESGEADVYASIGWAHQSLGEVQHALSSYEAARDLFVSVGNKNGEVRARLGMGSLYQSFGDPDKAVEQYKLAAPYASGDQFARMLVSVAQVLQSRNQPRQALRRYEAALSLIQSMGDPVLEGAILAGMGRCYIALFAFREAQYNFEQARARMKEAGDRGGEAGVTASIGELNYWTAITALTIDPAPRYKEALRNYNEALSLMRAVGDRTGEIGVLTNTGLVFDAWGKSREALGYYLAALEKMDELQTSARLDEFRIDLAAQSSRLYQRAVQLEIVLHREQDAFELSERARARTFLDQLGNSRIDISKHLPADFSLREERLRQENISLERQLGQELAKPGPEVNPERIHVLQSRLSVVRKEYEGSISDLKLSIPEYSAFLSISPITLRDAQQQLSPDVTLVSYFTTPQTTFAFILTKGSFHVSKLSVTEVELARAVTTLLDFPSQNDAPPTLKSLHKWLIAPIKSHLKTPMLAFVPFGILHDLPFAALTPDGKRYLVDDYAVFSLPSASVLPYIGARIKPAGSRALVLANDQEEGRAHLSKAYDEARQVASLFGVEPLLGDAATASMVQTSAGNYDIVHVIAHIDLDNQNPLSSHVVLGGAKGSDGELSLDQVFGLDLRKTNLVVLSGCQSLKGKRSRGDDVIGLSRAFIYAGSPSVVASLWSVDDDATQQLMVAFYTHLKEGLSKAEALRDAQRDVRHRYPNPYYWSGFVLTGDPGRSTDSNLLASSTK